MCFFLNPEILMCSVDNEQWCKQVNTNNDKS